MEKANLVIDQATAKKLFPKAGEEMKAVFEATFGKEAFSQKITDRVKSFEDACELLDIDPDAAEAFEDEDGKAYFKLKTIIRALNEGWEPNYDNGDQRKWYPWFYMDKPGFRLFGYYYGYPGTCVGARLVFRTRKLAEYAGEQFLDLYRDFMVLE